MIPDIPFDFMDMDIWDSLELILIRQDSIMARLDSIQENTTALMNVFTYCWEFATEKFWYLAAIMGGLYGKDGTKIVHKTIKRIRKGK